MVWTIAHLVFFCAGQQKRYSGTRSSAIKAFQATDHVRLLNSSKDGQCKSSEENSHYRGRGGERINKTTSMVAMP